MPAKRKPLSKGSSNRAENEARSKILRGLHADHANQVQLLGLIETEIEKCEAVDGKPDYELLTLALEYCTDYPGRYHHPKEDLMYRKLLLRDPAIGNRAAALTEEHATLHRLTEEFAAAVASAIEDNPCEKLGDKANRFIQYYRHHIGIEEAEVFPRARRALTDDDWQDIDEAYEEINDPAFGENTRQAYLTLHRRILTRASEG